MTSILSTMMNLRNKLILCQLLIIVIVNKPVIVSAQTDAEGKNIFTQAESYYIYEEYELANPLYILIENPNNMNIKYKIGTCYLNIPGEKEKSIPYLEEAAINANNSSKSELFKELRAPLDVYFSLAKAYMINNDFEKALNTFQTFIRLATESNAVAEIKNFDYIDHEISACKNAIQFRKFPVAFGKQPIWADLSLGSMNENPAVSFDGNTMVFTERRGIENAIFCSRKEGGQWQPPVEITGELNCGSDCSSNSLNKDGTELFLYKNDNYDGAIYSSTWLNGAWTPIKKLNKNINTKYYESHASVSADGKKLYFTSNRLGGLGNLDIYVSEMEKTGDWGPAVNLGPDINTRYNEDTPFITENDSILYFSSESHNSMGGYDNFKSRKNETGWNTASNLGYPINSADDDKFFQPMDNGRHAFYSITTDYKKKGIFYLDMGDGKTTLINKITGKLLLSDSLTITGKNSSVNIINRISSDTLYRGYPDQETGSYSIDVAPGLFKIVYKCMGYIPQTVDTLITDGNPGMVINIDVSLSFDSTTLLKPEPEKYEKIELAKIPDVANIDSSILIKNMNVNDVSDNSINESDVLFYTVQVIALHKPVDVSYFKYISDMKVIYNDNDKFYRYTTGKFTTREEAYTLRSELIKKGYPRQIFVKKVSK